MIISFLGGTWYYQYMAGNLQESLKNSGEEVVWQLYDTVDSRIEAVNNRVHAMLINNSFAVTLANYLVQPDEGRVAVTMGMIADFLKNLELGEQVIHSVYIYTEEGCFDDFSLLRNWEFDFQSSVFYQKFQKEYTTKHWFYAMEDSIFQTNDMVVPCVWRFRVVGYTKDCYLVVQYRKSELDSILEGKEHFFDEVMMVDEDGHKIAGTGDFDLRILSEKMQMSEEEEVFSDTFENDGKRYLAVACRMPESEWTIWCLKSQESMFDDLRNIRRMTIGIAGGLCLLCLAVTWFLARHLTDALSRLAQRMNCVTNGDLEARFFYPYRDEVGSLAKSFNYMIGEMKRLIESQERTIEELREERDRVAEIQKQKRKAELKALQAQINPHFLYNTLNAITWQAADQGAEEIARLSNLLGRFFRLSLRKGAETVTLREEAEHAKSYLDIQTLRYRSKIRYEIDLPEETREVVVIKLILQPLVENSIYHGIKEKQGEGLIRIRAEKKSSEGQEILELSVWDNGIGMEEEKTAMINAGLRAGITDRKEGYGIYNVNERILLYYGKAYGLQYESEPGMWTKAVITNPNSKKIKEEEEE